MSSTGGPKWFFLTNHARVLLCIAKDPGVRLRDMGEDVGITERAAHRIVNELAASGYISRTREGRRSHYTIQSNLPLPDSLVRGKRVGDLLRILGAQDSLPINPDRAARATRTVSAAPRTTRLRRPSGPVLRLPGGGA